MFDRFSLQICAVLGLAFMRLSMIAGTPVRAKFFALLALRLASVPAIAANIH
jgi:hypothetical protein